MLQVIPAFDGRFSGKMALRFDGKITSITQFVSYVYLLNIWIYILKLLVIPADDDQFRQASEKAAAALTIYFYDK